MAWKGLTTLVVITGIVLFLLLSVVYSISDRFIDWRESAHQVEIANQMRQNLIDMQSGATTRVWLHETQETLRTRIKETEQTKRTLGVIELEEGTKRYHDSATLVLAMILCTPIVFLFMYLKGKSYDSA